MRPFDPAASVQPPRGLPSTDTGLRRHPLSSTVVATAAATVDAATSGRFALLILDLRNPDPGAHAAGAALIDAATA